MRDLTTLPPNNTGGVSAIVPANLADTTRYRSLATLGDAGSTLDGVTAGERFGRQVANVGDVDGNGTADLAIGADFALRYGRTRAGEVTVALLAGDKPDAPEPEASRRRPRPRRPQPTATAVPTVSPDPDGRPDPGRGQAGAVAGEPHAVGRLARPRRADDQVRLRRPPRR